jgi:hypothetical protein
MMKIESGASLTQPLQALQLGTMRPRSLKMRRLAPQWREQQQAARLDVAIAANLKEFGYGG